MRNAKLLRYSYYLFISLVWLGPCSIQAAEDSATAQSAEAMQKLLPDATFVMEDFSKGPLQSIPHKPSLKTLPLDLRVPIQGTAESSSTPDPMQLPPTTAGFKGKEQQVSISELRAQALSNNLSLQVASLDPVIAQTTVREEEAKFDKIIFANTKYSHKDTPAIGSDIVQFKSNNPELDGEVTKLQIQPQVVDLWEGEGGIAIPLRTGGTVKLSTPFENKKLAGQLGSDEYRSALRFSISQPLLRNAGVATNTASIQIARLERQAVDAKTRLQALRVISMVDKAYWALYAAWSELDVRRQQHEYATRNLEMVRTRVAEGITAAIEINRAEIGVADRLEALIIANTKLKLAQRQLKFLLNNKSDTLDSSTLYIPVTDPKLVNYEFDRERIAEQALQGRLELLELELKLAADMNRIEYLENQTLPLFTLDYSYGALSNTEGNFSSAYRDVLNDRFSQWSLGLRFEMPLTNEANRMRLQRAVQQRLQRLTTRTLQEQTILREIYDALDQVDQNWQRINTVRQQVIVAGLNYEAELKQFNEGLRTMTEVLETLTRLGEAQIKEIRSITDYQISLIDLAYATGTLFGYAQIDFEQRSNSQPAR